MITRTFISPWRVLAVSLVIVILFACPRSDDGEVNLHRLTVEGVLLYRHCLAGWGTSACCFRSNRR